MRLWRLAIMQQPPAVNQATLGDSGDTGNAGRLPDDALMAAPSPPPGLRPNSSPQPRPTQTETTAIEARCPFL